MKVLSTISAQSLSINETIQVLSLSSSKIKDNYCQHLAEILQYNGDLACLCLCDDQITDRGMTDLINALTTNNTLKWLNAFNNSINQCVTPICELLKENRTLQGFNLSVGIDIACCVKTKKPVRIYESFFNVISECHGSVSHGGRDKTLCEVNSHYSWVPRRAIKIFLKHCTPCQVRKPIKQHVVSKPIISSGVMTRLQVDLVDMRTRPDKIEQDVVFNWILNCIDHFSNFAGLFR
ncbi:unnamed protein product [Didymodactylos carnosus]|uniref:Integrase zinc-binding domain-containing protein n=1 Tax=Didymodactylos carnosus TaxID=1234261 RepID=A0A8S2ELC7_9BILA|nr:unnamed protein product [Didymodactylos carnosus]CAF4004555.1 unnamed protein product [Didymodactylos carnosus]